MLNLTLSQAVGGFILDIESRRLSPSTIANYTLALRRFQESIGDRQLGDVTSDDVRRFLAWLATATKPLSRKTILNHHIALSAFWTWAIREGITTKHILHDITPPRPEKPAVKPFSEQDVRALLAACERTRAYSRPGKRACDNVRATGLRDRTIVLLLVDTGMRASELCGLTIRDVDVKNRRAYVMGKGGKARLLPFSAETSKAIWKYVNAERGQARMDDRLFVTIEDQPLERNALLQMINRLGERAGVLNCYPHRFRHTFAIQFLRNGGNVYELQMMLGHATLEMVKSYLALAQTDVDEAHREASPVARWHLH